MTIASAGKPHVPGQEIIMSNHPPAPMLNTRRIEGASGLYTEIWLAEMSRRNTIHREAFASKEQATEVAANLLREFLPKDIHREATEWLRDADGLRDDKFCHLDTTIYIKRLMVCSLDPEIPDGATYWPG